MKGKTGVVPTARAEGRSGRQAILLAAMPGVFLTIGIAASEVFRTESWSSLPFLLFAGVAMLTLRIGDPHVAQFGRKMSESGAKTGPFDGKLLPTGRRYLSFQAARAGLPVRWCIGVVWLAWCAPVGLVLLLVALTLSDVAVMTTAAGAAR